MTTRRPQSDLQRSTAICQSGPLNASAASFADLLLVHLSLGSIDTYFLTAQALFITFLLVHLARSTIAMIVFDKSDTCAGSLPDRHADPGCSGERAILPNPAAHPSNPYSFRSAPLTCDFPIALFNDSFRLP